MTDSAEVPDSWEELEALEEQQSRQAPPVGSKKSEAQPTKSSAKPKGDDGALSAKLEAEKAVERSEHDLIGKLLGSDGGNTTGLSEQSPKEKTATSRTRGLVRDEFDSLELTTLKQVEEYGEKLSNRINASQAKSVVWLRLMDLLLTAASPKMDEKDLTTLIKKLTLRRDARAEAKRVAEKSKRKPNDTSSVRNYQEEVDIVYGDFDD